MISLFSHPPKQFCLLVPNPLCHLVTISFLTLPLILVKVGLYREDRRGAVLSSFENKQSRKQVLRLDA